MMKRIFTLIVGIILVCLKSWANAEFNITLDRGDHQEYTEALPYGIVSFRLVEYGNYHKMLVSIENTTTKEAILLFKNSRGEKELKKNKPKIEFAKKYAGSKDERKVHGFTSLNRDFVSIVPQEKVKLSEFVISQNEIKVELPIYLASYNPKQLAKKGADNINYKILCEEIFTFNIEIKGWSENDPVYVSTKNSVEDYIRSVNTAAFCKNKKHRPTLVQQQKPYKDKKDSLIKVIGNIVETNGWMSDTDPYNAYKNLRNLLEKINLNDHTYDCGEHKGNKDGKGHEEGGKKTTCSYCSLNPQQIYHQLDDTYQQLRNGKITKAAASKKARALYNCYQRHDRRKKESSYSDKISRFYSRITNY